MKIAITGGIGAGKSFVCQWLRKYGLEVYDCDAAAKRLMRSSSMIRSSLIALIGEHVYEQDKLQKRVMAEFILASPDNVQAVNDIVHPAVAADFEQSGYDWLESAILFDSNFHTRIDINKVVCVTAPLETRISRIMRRDGISREKALEWIHRQLPQEEVIRLSNYEICNDGNMDVDLQVRELLKEIYNS